MDGAAWVYVIDVDGDGDVDALSAWYDNEAGRRRLEVHATQAEAALIAEIRVVQ